MGESESTSKSGAAIPVAIIAAVSALCVAFVTGVTTIVTGISGPIVNGIINRTPTPTQFVADVSEAPRPTFALSPTNTPLPTPTSTLVFPSTNTPLLTSTPTNPPQLTPILEPLEECTKGKPCNGDNEICSNRIAACEMAFTEDPNNEHVLDALTGLYYGRTMWDSPPSPEEDFISIIKYHDNIMRFAENSNATPVCQMLIRLGESYLLLDNNDDRASTPLQTFQNINCTSQTERVQCDIETGNPVECRRTFK